MINLADYGLVSHSFANIKLGDRFGRLLVLATGKPPSNYRYQVICQCDCGSPPKAIRADNLLSGVVVGCGCVRLERSRTHGLTKHPLYNRHRQILDRCINPNNPAYPGYGGRGISVCQRWLNVENFVSDLEPVYKPGFEIDRINNDGNYEPGNVRFVTRAENCDNRRSAHLLTYQNKTQSLKKWCIEYDIPYPLLWDRISKRKWSAEKALNTPPLNAKERMQLARSARKCCK